MQAGKGTRKVLLVLAYTACLLAGTAPAADLPAYAPVKERACRDCRITVPTEMTPRRGVVISQGGFNTVGYWSAVDIDQSTMTRFITQINQQTHKLYVVQSRVVQLSGEDMGGLIGMMNQLWRSPEPLPVQSATDAVWGLDLFDGAATRKEYGLGVIQGQGAELNNAIDVIWRKLAR